MDRVRFGRALGYGARHAAKALMQAADAATAPQAASSSQPSRPVQTSRVKVTPRPDTQQQRQTREPQSRANASRFGRASKSFLHPLKRYSGAVLLQVVGTFFAVFALLMAQAAWKYRGGLHQRSMSTDGQHLWLTVVLFLVFAWFAVSSFLRAHRLDRN